MGLIDSIVEIEELSLGNLRYIDRASPTFIPVHLTGGIGDVIMAGQTIRDLSIGHSMVVYSGHAKAFNYFYGSEKAKPLPMPEYKWHLELNTVARFRFSGSFHKFEIPLHEELFLKQQNIFKEHPAVEEMTRNHPHKDFLISRFARERGLDRRTFALFSLGLQGNSYAVMKKEVPQKYITVHDGYDVANFSQITGASTKQWPLRYWAELISKIKIDYPHLSVIQLGSKTGRPIPFVDKQMLNKTTIEEAFDILSKSSLHIDGDSGLVHAATVMQVPCIVMFGPTPDYFFGYPQNTNLRSGKTCENACFWINEDWMANCGTGEKSSLCMEEIKPDRVLQAVMKRAPKP